MAESRMQEIAQEIKQHYEENPGHGIGCVCLDKYISELKREFRITEFWLHEEGGATEKAGRAMSGVLHSVWQNIYHYQRSKCTCPDDFYAEMTRTNDCPIHGLNKNDDPSEG